MKREFLSNLGLEKDVIDKIMAENGKDLTASTTTINELTTKVNDLTVSNTTLSNENAELKKVDGAALQKQIDDLTTEKNELVSNHQKEVDGLKFENALQTKIGQSKTIDPVGFKAHLDAEKLKLNDKGELEGFDEQLETIKGSYAYLFNEDATGTSHGGIDTTVTSSSLNSALHERYK